MHIDVFRAMLEGGEVWAIEPTVLAMMRMVDSADHARAVAPPSAKSVAKKTGSLAVVPIHGVMSQRSSFLMELFGGTSTDQIGASIAEAAGDSTVKAIVLHVDSPGGSTFGVRELAGKVAAAAKEKPVIAQVDSLAASAAYWVASQATEIVSTHGGMVGSIGAYTIHDDMSEMAKAAGIDRTYISAGKHKVDGHPFAPLSDEHREYLQDMVQSTYDDFVAAVAQGRGVSKSAVKSGYGQGQVVRASVAKNGGMIDRIESFDETVARYQGASSEDRRRRQRAYVQMAKSQETNR